MLFTEENFGKIKKIKNGEIFTFKNRSSETLIFLKYNDDYCLEVDDKHLSFANFSKNNKIFETKIYPYFIDYKYKQISAVEVACCHIGIDIMPIRLSYSSVEDFELKFPLDKIKYEIHGAWGETSYY